MTGVMKRRSTASAAASAALSTDRTADRPESTAAVTRAATEALVACRLAIGAETAARAVSIDVVTYGDAARRETGAAAEATRRDSSNAEYASASEGTTET
jgi:hypothetical protein